LVQGLDLCCCQRVGRTSLSDPLAVAVVPDVPGNAFAYAGIDIGVVTRHRPGSSGLQRGEREERTAEVRPFQACQLLLLRCGVILGRQAFAGHGINLLLQRRVECSRGNVIPLRLILRVRLFGAQHLLPIFGSAGANGDVGVASSLVQVVSVAARRRRSRRPVALGGVLYSHVYSPAVSSLVSLSTSGVDAASTNTFEVSTSPSNRVSPDESTRIGPLASDSAFGGTTGCPCSSAVTRSCRSSTWSLRIEIGRAHV